MKCLKNLKNGNIIRVEDKTADQMVGLTWKYTSKDEWRKFNGVAEEKETKTEKVTVKKKKRTPKEVEEQYDLGGSE